MSNVLHFPAVPPAEPAQVVVSVTDRDGSALLAYPVVPESGVVGAVLMPGFVTGRADRNRVRAALREALAFLGADE